MDHYLILDKLFDTINSHGVLNQYLDTDADGNYYIALDGSPFSFTISIEITERPYVSHRTPAIYYPVDLASPEETEIGGKFDFYITKIECFDDDGNEYDLSDVLDQETLEEIKQSINFNEDDFIKDDELYESRKIRLTEQDIAFMVKRAINEIIKKRANKKSQKAHDENKYFDAMLGINQEKNQNKKKMSDEDRAKYIKTMLRIH